MAGLTNRGKYLLMSSYFLGSAVGAPFKAVLVTETAIPTALTNTLSQLTECPDGNGYTTGGIQLDQSVDDFTVSEDDTGNLSKAIIRDLQWTAVGGAIPASGIADLGALVICDASDNVLAYFVFTSPFNVEEGRALICQGNDIRITEA